MATGNISEVVTMYQTLVKDWNKKPVNLEKCGKLLSSLKVRKNNALFAKKSPLVKWVFPLSNNLFFSKKIPSSIIGKLNIFAVPESLLNE